jgi:hypothetical protein
VRLRGPKWGSPHGLVVNVGSIAIPPAQR